MSPSICNVCHFVAFAKFRKDLCWGNESILPHPDTHGRHRPIFQVPGGLISSTCFQSLSGSLVWTAKPSFIIQRPQFKRFYLCCQMGIKLGCCRSQPLAQPPLQPMDHVQMLFLEDGGGLGHFLIQVWCSCGFHIITEIDRLLLHTDSFQVIQLHPFDSPKTSRNHFLWYCYPTTSGGIQRLGGQRTLCSWILKVPFQSCRSSGWPTESPLCIAGSQIVQVHHYGNPCTK